MSAALIRWVRPFHRNNSSATGPIVNHISRLGRDECGGVALLAGLTLMLICGAVGLAIDVGVWYRTARAMQNAADAAAVAAARDSGTGRAWSGTGQAVAARYGFVDGVEGITVQIANNQTCPNGAGNCFKATIHDEAAPQFFSKVLGVPAPPLSASATVSLTAGASQRQYCILALATSGTPIRTNGAPFADLRQCNIMSNNDMTCNGHNLNADFADAAGTNNGCGRNPTSGVPRVTDPFSGLAANITPGSASSLPAGSNPSLPASTTISGDLTLAPNAVVNLRTDPGGSVLYIQNGTLNLNGGTLKVVSGGGLTIVFTGTNGVSASPAPYPTGNGTLDIKAPTSGPWSGVAIYIDPRTTAPQSIRYHGNSPTWNISGLVYMPRADLTVSGAVDKSSTGADCFALVVNTFRINGTGSILARGGCSDAGVTLPTNTLPNGSPALVL
jgi:Flp pilus assembly protein TadG